MEYTKAYSQYGASMGRQTYQDHEAREAVKFRLTRVTVNRDGYDPGGAYWGSGDPLYCAECETDDDHGIRSTRRFFRAKSREACKALILREYANARFYR